MKFNCKSLPRTITRKCCVCGELFEINLNDEGLIPENVFYGGKYRRGVLDWPAYRMEGDRFIRVLPWYKHYWRLFRDYVKILFHQYEEFDYWECPKCKMHWCENEK